jgi:hypothetical protein
MFGSLMKLSGLRIYIDHSHLSYHLSFITIYLTQLAIPDFFLDKLSNSAFSSSLAGCFIYFGFLFTLHIDERLEEWFSAV